MPDDWRNAPTEAAKLAAWTTLSSERFGDAYSGVADRASARQWRVLEADVRAAMPAAGRDELVREACKEAAAYNFLGALASAVGAIEADRDGRPAEEVGELLTEVAGSGVMQRITDRAKGLMTASILGTLDSVSKASAIVFENGNQVGTALLVGPDIVITAAHVALREGKDDGGSPIWLGRLRPNLSFSFEPAPTDPSNQRVVVAAAAAEQPVSFALPHGTPPNRLERSLAAPASERLDFAMVRLARQVEHVRPVDITTPGSAAVNRAFFVFGYPGGTALMFDAGPVASIDGPSGRVLHRVNTAQGMSGGCCVGADGSVVALHEGAVPQLQPNGQALKDAQGNELFDNRGVSLGAIREKQRASGRDPLTARPRSQGVEFADPLLVEALYKSGLRFGGPDNANRWRALVQGLLDLPSPPGDGVDLPAFHPWIPRRDIESWIDGRKPADRLCYVGGPDGAGKSFCTRILHGKLDNPALDLVVLNATQTSSWSWEEAIGPVIGRSDGVTRTEAATVRYDDVPAIRDWLAATGGGPRTEQSPLFVAIDFDAAPDGVRIGQTPWQTFIEGMVRERWARLMLIGLTQSERDMVDDLVASNELSSDIDPASVDLQYLGRNDLVGWGRALAAARGKPLELAEIRRRIDKILALPMLMQGTQPTMQTVDAVLAAFAFERTL